MKKVNMNIEFRMMKAREQIIQKLTLIGRLIYMYSKTISYYNIERINPGDDIIGDYFSFIDKESNEYKLFEKAIKDMDTAKKSIAEALNEIGKNQAKQLEESQKMNFYKDKPDLMTEIPAVNEFTNGDRDYEHDANYNIKLSPVFIRKDDVVSIVNHHYNLNYNSIDKNIKVLFTKYAKEKGWQYVKFINATAYLSNQPFELKDYDAKETQEKMDEYLADAIEQILHEDLNCSNEYIKQRVKDLIEVIKKYNHLKILTEQEHTEK